MTDRTLTITAAEWASVHDGTLWLVREGSDCTEGDHCYTAHDDNAQHPPAEFVQACAFCTACDARLWDRGHNRKTDCLDCRIELVGPCHCQLDAWHAHYCFNGTVTLGYAYAVGQPLPIVAFGDWLRDETITACCVVAADGNAYVRGSGFPVPNITAALAHYGPPKSLAGWALQVQVVA